MYAGNVASLNCGSCDSWDMDHVTVNMLKYASPGQCGSYLSSESENVCTLGRGGGGCQHL